MTGFCIHILIYRDVLSLIIVELVARCQQLQPEKRQISQRMLLKIIQRLLKILSFPPLHVLGRNHKIELIAKRHQSVVNHLYKYTPRTKLGNFKTEQRSALRSLFRPTQWRNYYKILDRANKFPIWHIYSKCGRDAETADMPHRWYFFYNTSTINHGWQQQSFLLNRLESIMCVN